MDECVSHVTFFIQSLSLELALSIKALGPPSGMAQSLIALAINIHDLVIGRSIHSPTLFPRLRAVGMSGLYTSSAGSVGPSCSSDTSRTLRSTGLASRCEAGTRMKKVAFDLSTSALILVWKSRKKYKDYIFFKNGLHLNNQTWYIFKSIFVNIYHLNCLRHRCSSWKMLQFLDCQTALPIQLVSIFATSCRSSCDMSLAAIKFVECWLDDGRKDKAIRDLTYLYSGPRLEYVVLGTSSYTFIHTAWSKWMVHPLMRLCGNSSRMAFHAFKK